MARLFVRIHPPPLKGVSQSVDFFSLGGLAGEVGEVGVHRGQVEEFERQGDRIPDPEIFMRG